MLVQSKDWLSETDICVTVLILTTPRGINQRLKTKLLYYRRTRIQKPF